jgi:hypothetical protein
MKSSSVRGLCYCKHVALFKVFDEIVEKIVKAEPELYGTYSAWLELHDH